MKNKKAISPLIATVLLIGFTVALAAVVMTWGGGFIRKTTESTETSAETTLACANLNLEVTGFSCAGGTVTISNSKNTAISELVFRKLDADGNLVGGIPVTNKEELIGYGIKTYNGVLDATVYKIQIIPTLKGGVTCADAPLEKVVSCNTIIQP